VTRWFTGLLVAALVVLTSGCEIGQDDEMAPAPRRTITATPSPEQAIPTTVPVGKGKVSPTDVVWAQGNMLHVGKVSVDLSPVGIDAFVVVPGGVFVLYSGELWFTDLSRLRGTGLTGVTGLGVTADATRILVTEAKNGDAEDHAYDNRTGKAVSSEGVRPVTAGERLQGPDRSRVVVPKGFTLAGWAGARRFYGVAGKGAHPSAVVSCDLRTRACIRVGRIQGQDPVVFGTGR
jgi:hypothetical protein